MPILVATVVEGMCGVHVRALAAAERVRALQMRGHGRAGAAAASTRGRGRAALLLHVLRCWRCRVDRACRAFSG